MRSSIARSCSPPRPPKRAIPGYVVKSDNRAGNLLTLRGEVAVGRAVDMPVGAGAKHDYVGVREIERVQRCSGVDSVDQAEMEAHQSCLAPHHLEVYLVGLALPQERLGGRGVRRERIEHAARR